MNLLKFSRSWFFDIIDNGVPAAVLSAVRVLAFIIAFTRPLFSSIRSVLAGIPLLSSSLLGTLTILIAVVSNDGTREGMKRIVWEGVWMEVRWGVLLIVEEPSGGGDERREKIRREGH